MSTLDDINNTLSDLEKSKKKTGRKRMRITHPKATKRNVRARANEVRNQKVQTSAISSDHNVDTQEISRRKIVDATRKQRGLPSKYNTEKLSTKAPPKKHIPTSSKRHAVGEPKKDKTTTKKKKVIKSLDEIKSFLEAAIILKRGYGEDFKTRVTGVNTNTAMRQTKPKEGNMRGTVREVPIPKKGKHSKLIDSISDASTIKSSELNKTFNGLLDAYQDRWVNKLEFNADGSVRRGKEGKVVRKPEVGSTKPDPNEQSSFPVVSAQEAANADQAKTRRAELNRERVINEKRD
tara:strand:- start:354 stop:1229 length:876 start_codon:yes stop_codon:yes gene_type:complete